MIQSSIPPDVDEALKEANLRKAKAQQAQIDAAKNTSEMRHQMSKMIDNQQVIIESQKQIIE